MIQCSKFIMYHDLHVALWLTPDIQLAFVKGGHIEWLFGCFGLIFNEHEYKTMCIAVSSLMV